MISTFCRADRLRLAGLFVSKEAGRYCLNGVSVAECPEGGVRLAATNHRAFAVFHDDAGFTSATCIILLPESLLDAVKRCKHRDFVWFGIIGKHSGTGRHEARVFDAFNVPVSELADIRDAMGDITNTNVVWAGAVELIDGTFPDYEAIIPDRRAENGISAAFDNKYLAAFSEVAADLGDTPGCRVYPAGADPAIVDCGRSDFLGLVMPYRMTNTLVDVGNRIVAPPRWAKHPTAPVEVVRTTA